MKCSLLLLLAISSSLWASEKMSWENCVREAMSANSELSAAKNSLQSLIYLEKGSRSGFLPAVYATTGVSYDSTSLPKSYSTSVEAKENLFSGFSDSAKMDQAKFSRLSAEATLDTAKAKVSYELKVAFMGLVYSQRYIKLTEDIIKRREANLRLVQLRFESGRENIGSLNLSKAYLAQSKYDHVQAINSLQIYQAQLAQVLGRDNYDDIEVEGSVPTTKPQFEDTRQMNFKELASIIPDIKKASFDEQSALAGIDLSKSTFFPSLNLTQTVSRIGRESTNTSNTWSVGASITFPLFDGGKDYYSYKSSSEIYRGAKFTKKSVEESSITKLKDAYRTYVEGVMKLDVDQAFVVAAESRERIAKAQYNNGLTTFIDWDNIENDLINRQKSFLQTEKERVTAEAAWEQALGRGVIP